MDKRADSVVIGGGIIGNATAYYLAKRGCKVAVLEAGQIACKASGAAAGMLEAQTELAEDSPFSRFARRSRAMFPAVIADLEELSGVHIGYIDQGMYKVATTLEEAEELQKQAQLHRHGGEQADWLSAAELLEREPAVSEQVLGAMYIARDGQLQSYELSLAFARAAAALGGEIHEFTKVREWITEGGKIVGVRTGQGDFYADSFVAAGGAWSGELLARTGLELTMTPVKGECVSVISTAPLIKGSIHSEGCYIVPKSSGKLLIGATVKPGSWDERVSYSAVLHLLEQAKRLLPGLADAVWDRAWAGIRPLLGDGLPYLGAHPDYSNLFVAAGHYRKGILLAPATGKYMADLAEGKAHEFAAEMKAFGLERLRQSVLG